MGQCTLVLHPTEGPWGGKNIPEIVDLTVFFDVHKKGIGNRLLDAAEEEAERATADIDVGLDEKPEEEVNNISAEENLPAEPAEVQEEVNLSSSLLLL